MGIECLKEDGVITRRRKRNGPILAKPPKQIRTEHAAWPTKLKMTNKSRNFM